jgi:hypothetical protein
MQNIDDRTTPFLPGMEWIITQWNEMKWRNGSEWMNQWTDDESRGNGGNKKSPIEEEEECGTMGLVGRRLASGCPSRTKPLRRDKAVDPEGALEAFKRKKRCLVVGFRFGIMIVQKTEVDFSAFLERW